MVITRPEGAKHGAGPKPPAEKKDILTALECLQVGMRTEADLREYLEKRDEQRIQDYRKMLVKQGEQATALHVRHVVAYLASIGRPLGEEHVKGLRDALVDAHIETVEEQRTRPVF